MARKGRGKRVETVPVIDATPERLAKGDPFEMINPAEIDSKEQPIGRVRRFRSSHLDRLYQANRLSWTQWYAGDWYRNQHARCHFALSVVASYGEQTSASEPSYGLPRTEAQVRARKIFKAARDRLPPNMLGFMDRLLLYDDLPRYGGRAAMRNIADIADALDCLAAYLWLMHGPIDGAENSCEFVVNVANCANG